MSNPSLDAHVARFSEIAHRFLGRRAGIQVVLPDEIAQAKASLDRSSPGGRAAKVDYRLMYNITAILSRRAEPITMGELSRALDVPLSTATRLVDWLVDNDYVQRQPDLGDRRIVRVGLTDAGRRLCAIGDEFMRKRVERWMRHFTPQERETLITLVNKLIDVIEEESRSGDPGGKADEAF